VSESPPVPPAGEVRVSDYFRRAMRRWYVIVISVVAAVLLVFLHGVSGATNQATATASVYLGQPFSPGGSSVLTQTPLSNPTISINYVTAPQQIAAAAKAAGIDHRSLRSHVSVLSSGGATSAAAKTGGNAGSPTISITVEGPWTRVKVQKAPLAKVAAESPWVSDLATAGVQIGTLTVNLTNDQVALVATHDIESAQFIAQASGRKVSARTRRNSLVIAALVGLIVGTGLALAWEALAARPRPQAA
jgi:hypothetical protein